MAMGAGSIAALARKLRAGTSSSVELTREALDGIARLDDRLNAFVLVDRQGALEAAEAADAGLRSGTDSGPLTGIPVGVKDIIHMRGLPTRCGSPTSSNQARSADATVVTRLREAGAVIVGKTTTHELACGVYSAPAANPWDTNRLPGGSSGGSGAAVAAGVVPMALGTDTGGSIRIPASVCGVAGLKPTYGRVSRAGVEPLAWSLDHIGPLAATVADCALSLQAMAGFDRADAATTRVPVPDFSEGLDRGVDGLRIGVMADGPFSPMQADVAEAFAGAVEMLNSLEAELLTIEVPELDYTLPAEFAIVRPRSGGMPPAVPAGPSGGDLARYPPAADNRNGGSLHPLPEGVECPTGDPRRIEKRFWTQGTGRCGYSDPARHSGAGRPAAIGMRRGGRGRDRGLRENHRAVQPLGTAGAQRAVRLRQRWTPGRPADCRASLRRGDGSSGRIRLRGVHSLVRPAPAGSRGPCMTDSLAPDTWPLTPGTSQLAKPHDRRHTHPTPNT